MNDLSEQDKKFIRVTYRLVRDDPTRPIYRRGLYRLTELSGLTEDDVTGIAAGLKERGLIKMMRDSGGAGQPTQGILCLQFTAQGIDFARSLK